MNEKMIQIPIRHLRTIESVLRFTNNVYSSQEKITVFDIELAKAYEYANSALTNKNNDSLQFNIPEDICCLLERAASLVGNPGTNISGSTDLACQQWQKDYAIVIRGYGPKDETSINNEKMISMSQPGPNKDIERQYLEYINRPGVNNLNMIELDSNTIKTKREALFAHISNCDMNTWWWGDNYDIVVDEGDGSVLLYYKTNEPHTAWIYNLHVASSMRKKGIGTILLNICIEKAKADDKKFIKLYADKTKQWLVDWYTKFGFIITEECDHEFEMTEIITK